MRSLIETTYPVFDNCDSVLTEYLRIETLEERSDEVHLLTHSLIRIRNDQRIDPHIDEEDQHFSDFMGEGTADFTRLHSLAQHLFQVGRKLCQRVTQ